jgi:hypothetical protein
MKITLRVKFQNIMGIKKKVTSELNAVPLDVFDDFLQI